MRPIVVEYCAHCHQKVGQPHRWRDWLGVIRNFCCEMHRDIFMRKHSKWEKALQEHRS